MSKKTKRGRPSVRRQLLNSIRDCYKPGRDKHAAKKAKPGEWQDGTIYSRKTRENREEVVKMFGDFLRAEFPDVKRAVDITERHVNAFLAVKAMQDSGAVSQRSLGRYASELRGIVKGVQLVYGRSAADPSEIVTPRLSEQDRARAREIAMDRDDRERLERSFKPGSNGARALALSRIAGLRIQEAACLRSDRIAPDGSVVYVRAGAKGDRDRDVPVHDPVQREELVRMREATPPGGLVLRGIKAESADRTIRRHMEKIGIAEKYAKTTYHSMRKTWSQERYDYYRSGDMTRWEAIRAVNKELGHEEDRDIVLLGVYVENIW